MSNNKPMTKKKIFLITSLFFLLLSSFRIGWMLYHKTPDHPHAEEGVIDLSDWEFNDHQTITLDGEWEFYPNYFISPTLVRTQQKDKNEFISVPGDWKSLITKNEKIAPYGYGTYRLKIILPDNKEQLYGIRIKDVTTAAHVYIDGTLVAKSGRPGETAEDSEGNVGPFSTSFSLNRNEVDLMIHVSNYKNPLHGGITKSIQIGTDTAINKEAKESITLQIVVSVIYLLHSLYAFVIYFIGKGKYQKEIFYFGLMLALHGLTILIDDDIVLHLPIHFEWYHNILQILFISTLFSLVIFIKHLFNLTSRFMKILTIFFIVSLLIILITPFRYSMIIGIGIMFFYILSISFLFNHTIRTIRGGHPDAIFILLFITSYTSNMIWGGIINLGLVELPYYPFDFIISIFVIALLLFKRYIRMAQINKEQTKELQKADRMKDEFLANTSHEIRNPLHGIINIARSILDENADTLTKKSKENLTLLINIGKRMSFTLNDLSVVTQLKEQKVTLHKTSINLHMITSTVLDMLDFMKEGKDITLHSNISAQFPYVLADENRLIQILFNLIHNAIKFTEEGAIVVEADYSKEMATIYVKDTGIGISSYQNMEQIFKAYEQQDRRQKTAVSGVGIGLSVAKQLVELHGGMITYQSTNHGTTFIFTIPLANKKENLPFPKQTHQAENYAEIAATETADKIPTNKDTKENNILIVDDDPVNIKVLSEMLVSHYNVFTALSSKEALQTIEKNRFDLIISDVMMPYMSGYELTKKIRKKYTISELPILLITARGLPEDIHVAFKSGANDYLIKPVNSNEIKTRVKALTNLKHSVKELLRLEAAWLQAQIHPHFLHNTLNSIASLAEIDKERMITLLEAFGTYLQRSFSTINVESEIPLAYELELTKSYIYIEKVRFGNRLHVDYDIDENLNIKIPPLSIQPLVENAIEHGILKKAEGGTIKIQVKDYTHSVEITIEDDGIGMEQDKIDELLQPHYVIGDGVGVKNTNRRLIKFYGKGLIIKSSIGKGTIVQFNVPKRNINKQ